MILLKIIISNYLMYCNHVISLNVYEQIDRFATTYPLLWTEVEKTFPGAIDLIKTDGCCIQYLIVY